VVVLITATKITVAMAWKTLVMMTADCLEQYTSDGSDGDKYKREMRVFLAGKTVALKKNSDISEMEFAYYRPDKKHNAAVDAFEHPGALFRITVDERSRKGVTTC
jgi:hypothetical protein